MLEQLLAEQRAAADAELGGLRAELRRALSELEQLRAGAPASRTPQLQPQRAEAPAAEETEEEKKKRERKRTSILGNIELSADRPVAEQLREALSKNAGRVIDLFREWDADGDGNVSKKEFRKAMPKLGFDVPTKDIDALFDSFDPDGSGSIDFTELKKMLRPPPPQPAKKNMGKLKGAVASVRKG